MSHLRKTHCALLIATASAAMSIPACVFASTHTGFSGQWIGNSEVDGTSIPVRTTLTLGAPDADDSTLALEGNRTCMLKRGSYSASSGDALTLTFKLANGGDACERLAKGTFTVRAGESARSITFEAIYPDAKGGKNLRRGVLSRYP